VPFYLPFHQTSKRHENKLNLKIKTFFDNFFLVFACQAKRKIKIKIKTQKS
jgi:hypothetical protein